MSKCNGCKGFFTDTQFGSRVVRGCNKVYKTCPPCREKAKSPEKYERMRQYNKTEARKQVLHKYSKSDTFYEARKYYRVHSDAFKERRKKLPECCCIQGSGEATRAWEEQPSKESGKLHMSVQQRQQ